MNDTITRLHAREVLDSRGVPTVEVEVYCGDTFGRAIVPSGASTGTHEAVELRDSDERHRGKSVRKAVAHVREVIAPKVVGLPASAQEQIDRLMIDLDGTPNKSRLGANAILGVSLACAHAAAAARRQPLWRYLARGQERMPLPMVNMISGGLHAGGNLDFQDYLLLPIGARSYSEALDMAGAVYQALFTALFERGLECKLVGDEGGFGPVLESNEQGFELLTLAIERAGLKPGVEAAIALDVASTEFHERDHYRVREFPHPLTSVQMVAALQRYSEVYPIQSIEDGCAEDDWAGWKLLTQALGSRLQLIGDDLFVTNPQRLQRGINEGVANAVLVKVNQIGTLTETLQVIELARQHGYRPVISARSGETEDTTIADLAVATGAGQIKIGSVARSERLAKYNQLLRIEEALGADRFARWE